jgi:retron-type reverse transcriptase
MYTLKPFANFCDPESLYASWRRFRRGKRRRKDILVFERHLEDELFSLSEDLASGKYVHSEYHRFYIRDPKYRMIHKAVVRDRVAHQALYDALQPLFENKFFFDSYSARFNKGTMRAIARVLSFIRKASKNGRQEAWIFHGDVDDFFSSIDHEILLTRLEKSIPDKQYFDLSKQIIDSFSCAPGKGLPLGNLTSQLFANAYLHELDYFTKQTLCAKHYVRYNDDFFIVADSRLELENFATQIKQFLRELLKLSLPDDKIKIRRLSQGVDILGEAAFPWGVVPRSRLRKAALRTITSATRKGYTEKWQSAVSYIGLLGNMKSFLLREKLRLAYLI